MAKVLTEGTTFTSTVTVPEDGDSRNAASVETPFQALTDRTRTLKNRLDAPEVTATIALTSNQSDWAPTGWSTADVLRIDPDASRNILGLSASGATVKRKLLVNIDQVGSIDLIHDDSGQSAGNKIFCPNNANYRIGPRGSVEVVYDSVSLVWRVVDEGVAQASAYYVAGEPTRTVFLPVTDCVAIAGDWAIGITASTTVDGAIINRSIRLPTGCEITRVRVGITVTGTPGVGNEPVLTVYANTPNTGAGTSSNSSLGSTTGSAASGSSVISVSLSETVDNTAKTYHLGLAAAAGGATITSLNWIELQFADSEIGNG